MAKLALILLAAFYLTGNLYAGGLVLNSKRLPTLPSTIFDCSDIGLTEVFIDADNNTFIRIGFQHEHPSATNFLYSNNGWVNLKQYGYLLDAFLKDGHFHLAFKKDEKLFFYKVEKDIELVNRISTADFVDWGWRPSTIDGVIPRPEPGNSYCLLVNRSLRLDHPIALISMILSGGHGIRYWKPYLVEVRDEKLGRPRRLRYGGKIDESYGIVQVAHQENFVHFLGLRVESQPEWGPRKKPREPLRLHHVAYDLKKKKVIQKHAIWPNGGPTVEKDDGLDRLYFLRVFSMDASGNDVFVTFPWIQKKGLQRKSAPRLNKFKSDVYYWQYSNGVASDVEKIAEGFCPLVKVDSSGNVHLLRVNKNGSLVHKAKQNGIWSGDRILVDKVDLMFSITRRKYIAAEFDKDNNLHLVYPSRGSLVHTVVKVN